MRVTWGKIHIHCTRPNYRSVLHIHNDRNFFCFSSKFYPCMRRHGSTNPKHIARDQYRHERAPGLISLHQKRVLSTQRRRMTSMLSHPTRFSVIGDEHAHRAQLPWSGERKQLIAPNSRLKTKSRNMKSRFATGSFDQHGHKIIAVGFCRTKSIRQNRLTYPKLGGPEEVVSGPCTSRTSSDIKCYG